MSGGQGEVLPTSDKRAERASSLTVGTSLRSISSRSTITEQWFPHIDFHNTADDDQEETDEEREYRRRWEESPFAVGYTRPSWSDEEVSWRHLFSDRSTNNQPGYVVCTSLCCGCLPVGRVGNMVVLRERMVKYNNHQDKELADEGDETSVTGSEHESIRPQLLCVVGPYFYVTLLITIPLLLAFSGFTLYAGILMNENLHFGMVVGWAFVTTFTFLSLLKTSCSDPGILYRHKTPQQVQTETGVEDDRSWWWNDQAQSYRPPKARFDPEIQAIVQDFDHTCPWTGTGIGKGNVVWFRWFVSFLALTVIYDLLLLLLSICS